MSSAFRRCLYTVNYPKNAIHRLGEMFGTIFGIYGLTESSVKDENYFVFVFLRICDAIAALKRTRACARVHHFLFKRSILLPMQQWTRTLRCYQTWMFNFLETHEGMKWGEKKKVCNNSRRSEKQQQSRPCATISTSRMRTHKIQNGRKSNTLFYEQRK